MPLFDAPFSLDTLRPALALPGAVTRVGLFGDSRAALNHMPFGDSATPAALAAISSQDYKPNKGFAYFAEMLSGGRIEFPRAGNYGITGNTSLQMATRASAAAAAIAAAGCTWVVIVGGTNDAPNGVTFAQTLAAYDQTEAAFRAQGVAVLWLAEYPRGHASATGNRLSGSQLQDHYGRHRALLGRANGITVHALDTMLYLSDGAAATAGDIRTNATYDGLHLNGQGSYWVGSQIAQFFIGRLPARDFLPGNNADLWSASNPGGSITGNPCLAGSGGTLASGVTGSLADGFGQGALPAGLSLAMSKGVDANGRAYQQAVISGTPTASFPNMDILRRDVTIGSGVAAGSKVRALCEYEWDAAPSGLWCLDFGVGAGNAAARTGAEQSDAANSVLPAQAVSGIAVSEPALVAASGVARLSFRVYAIQNVAASATVRIKRLAMVYV